MPYNYHTKDPNKLVVLKITEEAITEFLEKARLAHEKGDAVALKDLTTMLAKYAFRLYMATE